MIYLASDNFATVHPLVMKELNELNDENTHAVAYGNDNITKEVSLKFKDLFETNDLEVYFTFNGTGTNILAAGLVLDRFGAVLSPESSHLNQDECGALESQLGSKIIPIPSYQGKVVIDQLEPILKRGHSEHHVTPQLISITQSSEYGTCYSREELKAISSLAKKYGLFLHVDGARIANSVVSTHISLKEMIVDTGVDLLSFGGTKDGMMYGEALVVLNKNLLSSPHFDLKVKSLRKQQMQLPSKMRYVAVQFRALFRDDLWLKNGKRANDLAKKMESEIKNSQSKSMSKGNGFEILYPVEANALFIKFSSKEMISKLRENFFFWNFGEEDANIVRIMTAFDTKESDVASFTASLMNL